MLKPQSSSVSADSLNWIKNPIGQAVAEQVESSIQSFIGHCPKVQDIGAALLHEAGIRSVTEVAILLRDKVVGFMREQVFNDVLETEFVERVLGYSGLGLVLELGLEEVPIFQVQLDKIVIETCIAHLFLPDVFLVIKWVASEIVKFLHDSFVGRGSEDEINCIANHLVGSHSDQFIFHSVGCVEPLALLLELFPFILAIPIIPKISPQRTLLQLIPSHQEIDCWEFQPVDIMIKKPMMLLDVSHSSQLHDFSGSLELHTPQPA